MSKKETEEKLRELNIIEQNINQLLIQKQAFQLELNETESAEEEISKSKGEAYKILGQIMIKAEKNKIEKDLKEKIKLLELRLKSIETQEKHFQENAEKLREELTKKIK